MTALDAPISREGRLDELEFVAFDIETTGLSSRTDRIVEIGAIRFRGDGTEIDRFEKLVHPGRSIPPEVTQIHGITDEVVCHAPDEAEILPEFLQFLGDARETVLMAHNAAFDVGFLETALRRGTLAQPPHGVLDTVTFARRRARGLPSYRLGSLVRMFGIETATAHRGLADAMALKELFCLLAAAPPPIGTAADLIPHLTPEHRFQDTPRRRAGTWPRRRSRRRTSMSSPGPEALRSPWYHLLEQAARDGQPVTLIYAGGRAPGMPRTVKPIRLAGAGASNYLIALCDRDRIEKHFRLDRIREARVWEGENGRGGDGDDPGR